MIVCARQKGSQISFEEVDVVGRCTVKVFTEVNVEVTHILVELDLAFGRLLGVAMRWAGRGDGIFAADTEQDGTLYVFSIPPWVVKWQMERKSGGDDLGQIQSFGNQFAVQEDIGCIHQSGLQDKRCQFRFPAQKLKTVLTFTRAASQCDRNNAVFGGAKLVLYSKS